MLTVFRAGVGAGLPGGGFAIGSSDWHPGGLPTAGAGGARGSWFGQGDEEVAELALEGLLTLRWVTFGLLCARGSVYFPGEVDALFPKGSPEQFWGKPWPTEEDRQAQRERKVAGRCAHRRHDLRTCRLLPGSLHPGKTRCGDATLGSLSLTLQPLSALPLAGGNRDSVTGHRSPGPGSKMQAPYWDF